MQHILLGRQITTLGGFPYAADTLDACTVRAKELGIAIRDDGPVTTFPCMAAYVGGDIVAGLVAIGVTKLAAPLLFLDVGTNGELVLVTEHGMVAASTAAGPCFEGMTISCGMRAAHGAIEQVKLDGPVALEVIGGGRPKGICGSGLLDAVAELRRVNLVNERSRLQAADTAGVAERYRNHLFESRGKRHFRLHDGLSLSQEDIRQVQLAKAAIRAGIELLLTECCIEAAGLKKVVVAGAFGFHLREQSLLEIGMLPRLVGRKTHFVGNSSLEGAVRALLHPGTMEEAAGIARAARVVDLSQVPAFPTVFCREMRF
jgi:uncharacterized 2Fe-2S/4Fe-4S cluster protein (DUF4445 family)